MTSVKKYGFICQCDFEKSLGIEIPYLLELRKQV
jgi:hypothetical protein